jgi:hypothetical protein
MHNRLPDDWVATPFFLHVCLVLTQANFEPLTTDSQQALCCAGCATTKHSHTPPIRVCRMEIAQGRLTLAAVVVTWQNIFFFTPPAISQIRMQQLQCFDSPCTTSAITSPAPNREV